MSQPYNPYAQQPAAPAAPPQPMGGFVQQPQGYGQPPAPQYYPQASQPQYAPPQGYYPQPPQQYAPQPEPAPPGSLDAFYKQPTVGGGKALKFDQLGQSHTGVIAREITDADVVAQTKMGTSEVARFADGSIMYQLVVPLLLPDGEPATWYVKGATREVLLEAMAKAGCPAGTMPEKGAAIRVTWTGSRPTRFQPAKVYSVEYTRPAQAGGGMSTAQQPLPAPAGQPVPAPVPHVVQPVAEQPQYTPGAATPPAAGVPAPQGMTAEQFQAYQALLGQAGQPQQ